MQAATDPAATGPAMLGTALWLNDPSVRGEGALVGARFPGPDAGARQRFEERYREAFGAAPPRVAAAAYDAAALAARTLRDRTTPDGATALRSFDGADGPVRLLANGRTARGLAIYALSVAGEPALVESAQDPAGAGF